jgi:uncharacterized small protein (DUF1192 family)
MGRTGRGKAAEEACAVFEEEDLNPQRQRPKPKDLTLLGIAELEEYIATLEAEIARARGEITAKQKQRGGAEALFKR